MTRMIDRLLAKVGSELTHCEVEIDGDDFSYYVKPLTMMQLSEAYKPNGKGVKPTEFEALVRLLAARALNADGTKMFQADGYMTLMRLPVEITNALLSALPKAEEDEADLDYKSSDEGTQEGQSADVPNVRSGKAGAVAKAAA